MRMIVEYWCNNDNNGEGKTLRVYFVHHMSEMGIEPRSPQLNAREATHLVTSGVSLIILIPIPICLELKKTELWNNHVRN